MHDLSDKPELDGNQLSIGSAIERYLNFPGTNPKTRCNIRLRLNKFAQFMAEKHGAVRSVEELEKKHVTDLMLMMREAGALPSAIGHMRSTIYGWLQFLGENGFVVENVDRRTGIEQQRSGHLDRPVMPCSITSQSASISFSTSAHSSGEYIGLVRS